MISGIHLVFFLIALALVFDIFNGFHDAANSIATVVTTRVLSPVQAVAWAAFFNFVAAFVFGTGVAKTVSDKLIDPKVVDMYVIFGGLFGAIIWDIITWLMALPTSSSHAIISAYAGAAIAKAGFGSLLLKGWVPVLTFLVISPIVGLILRLHIYDGDELGEPFLGTARRGASFFAPPADFCGGLQPRT